MSAPLAVVRLLSVAAATRCGRMPHLRRGGILPPRKGLLAAVLFALTLPLHAAVNYTWTGAAEGDGENWQNPTNWGKTASGDYPKSTNYNVIFPADTDVTVALKDDITVYQITFNSGSSLTIKAADNATKTCPTLKANNNMTDSGLTALVLDGAGFYRASGWTPATGCSFTLKNGAYLYLGDFNMTRMAWISLSGRSSMSVSQFWTNGDKTLTIDDSTFTTRWYTYIGNANPGGGRIVFKGANPVWKHTGQDIRANNNAGMTAGCDFDFEVPAGGFVEAPIQHTGGKFNNIGDNMPNGYFRFNILETSPALTAGGMTDCALMLTPGAIRNINKLTLPSGDDISARYTDGTPEGTVTASASAKAIWVTIGSGDKLSPASDHGTLLGYTPTLAVARHVITETGWVSGYAAGSTSSQLELWVGEENNADTMTLASSTALTSEGVYKLSFTAPEDIGEKTYYFQLRLRDTSGGSETALSKTSVLNAATKDTTVYTWKAKGDNWNGVWTDTDHWSSNYKSAYGYPKTANATADFPAATAAVRFDESVTFGTFSITNKDMNLVFTAGDGVAVTCTTFYAGDATSVTKRHGSTIVFDGVELYSSDTTADTKFRPNPGNNITLTGGSEFNVYRAMLCVNDTVGTWYSDTTLNVEDGSALTVRNLLQVGGAGTLALSNATVNAANVYVNGVYKNGNGTYGGGGGRIRFYGDSPRLAVTAKMLSEQESYTGCFGADIEFFVPEGGYTAAPIYFTGTTKLIEWSTAKTSNSGKIRFAVHGKSPILSTTAYGSWDLISCTATTIDPTRIELTTPISTVTETMTLENGSNTLTYARYDPVSCLTITGYPREFGSGEYGARRGLADGAEIELAAPVSDNANLTCTGYKLYDISAKDGTRTLVEDKSTSGTTSFAYTHSTTRRELVWQWSRPDVYVATTGDDTAAGDKEHPLATIQAGINKYDCSVVHVAPGRYQTTTPTAIAAGKIVEVRGEGADPTEVILEKTANATRVLTIDENLATVTNITVTNGDRALQGGVAMSKGLITGCIVTHCSTANNTYDGAGINMTGGTVRGCVISNNLAQCSGGGGKSGGGIYMTGGLVENCRLIQNQATYGTGGHGGGIYASAGTIRGCLIDRCSARGSGIGLYANSAVVENCTIVGNYHDTSTSTGVALGKLARFRNNIVYGNSNVNGTANVSVGFVGTCEYNCTLPAFTYGDGNFGDPPAFEDYDGHDYRLTFCGCVNAALIRNWMDAAFDMDGTQRVVKNVPDMGCFERPPSTDVACTFSTEVSGGPDEADISLTAIIDGDTDGIVYTWTVTRADGQVTTQSGGNLKKAVFHVGAGDYSVTLSVVNGAGKSSSATVENVASVKANFAYVNAAGSEMYPFQTRAGGSHDLETAFNLLASGGTLYIAPGTYVVSNRLNLVSGNGTRLIGLDSPSNTIIRADGPTFWSTGLEIVKMTAASSRLDGLTLVGGIPGPYYSGSYYSVRSGVIMSAGIVTNCVLRDMYQYERTESSALYITGGTASDLLITDCWQGMSGGSPQRFIAIRQEGGTVDRTIVSNCWTVGTGSSARDGGLVVVSGGDFRNSLITDCAASHSAPVAISGGTMDNCTIVANKNTETKVKNDNDTNNPSGGLIASGTAVVRNTMLSGNTSLLAGGAVTNLWCTGSQVTYSFTDDRETFAGEGNLAGEAKFKSAADYDFHLLKSSAAMNAGVKLDWMSGAVDLDGAPRIRHGKPDIGCFERLNGSFTILIKRTKRKP